ncbi:MAG TPA: sugar ABC transporter permease [Candidatus Limnocylindria bacterium]|jgi:multiple sugar transport system permease protein|nr:sugar ABC transporter permease [Candidatus Limnocylindria bacterium]
MQQAVGARTIESRRTPWLMVLPALLLILAINIVPLVYSTVLAFFQWNLIQAATPPRFIGIDNFIRLITRDPQFISATLNTGIMVVATVAVQTVLGVAVALLLDQKLRFTGVATTLLLIPLALAPAVVGLLFSSLFNSTLGPVNYLLNAIGLPAPSWLGDAKWALASVIIVDTWQWTPFMILLTLAGLRSLNPEPIEAALVDGASAWQRFRYVKLPMLLPVLTVAMLLRAIDSFRTFDLVFLLTFGGPGTSSTTMSFYGFKVGLQNFDIGRASAIAFLMVQVFIIFVLLFYSRSKDQL